MENLEYKYGMHRVLDEQQCMPQMAHRLDPHLPLRADELCIEVDTLNIDSASFRQIREFCEGDPEKIKIHIKNLVEERGKLHNPVTGSGGMLSGKVAAIGKSYQGRASFKLGDEIATLVSLTLTPLSLREILKVHLKTGQLEVKGHAILFESGVAALIPHDMSRSLAVALYDVCGAPALVYRHVREGDKVLIVGAGKSGLLSAFSALEKVRNKKSIFLMDCFPEQLSRVRDFGFSTVVARADHPGDFIEALKNSAPFDLVVNTSNGDNTEMACILVAKPRGKVIYFNMATGFGKAVLGAEGIGADVDLLMGNGYVKGHSEFVLELLRKHSGLRSYLEPLYS